MSKFKSIKESFMALSESHTPINVIKFIDEVSVQPIETIIESARYIFSEPTKGAGFLLNTLRVSNIDTADLMSLKENINQYRATAINGGYQNTEHLNSLSGVVKYIDEKIAVNESIEFLRDDTIRKLSYLTEGNLMSRELDTVIRSMHTNSNAIANYVSVIEGIVLPDHLRYIPEILTKNTVIVREANNSTDLQVLSKALTFPSSVSDKIVEYGECSLEIMSGINNILELDIRQINELVESGEGNDFLTPYIGNMTAAHNAVNKLIQDRIQYIREHIGQMAPIYGGVVEEDVDLEDQLTKSFKDYFNVKSLQRSFSVEFVKAFFNEGEGVSLESINNLMSIAHDYDMAVELDDVLAEKLGVVRSAARKAALGAEKASRNTAHSMRRSQTANQRVTAVVKRVPKHIENVMDRTIGSLIKMDRGERRKRIIEGGYKTRLFRIIRNAIIGGTAFLVSPALAAVALIVVVANDKRLDIKVRRRIVTELETELTIVTEKIDDAKAANEKQKKYQLMRIKNKLEREIIRIKYNIKDMETEG